MKNKRYILYYIIPILFVCGIYLVSPNCTTIKELFSVNKSTSSEYDSTIQHYDDSYSHEEFNIANSDNRYDKVATSERRANTSTDNHNKDIVARKKYNLRKAVQNNKHLKNKNFGRVSLQSLKNKLRSHILSSSSESKKTRNTIM